MTGCGIWRKVYQEVSTWKPLFTAIYATVLVGVLFSSFYVFAAVYSSSTPWRNLSSSPAGQGRSNVLLPTTSGPLNSSSLSKPRNVAMRPIWEAPPKDKKMPPLETFRLTKGLVEQHVKDNVIIVTFGNYAFMDFILTWVKHLTDLGVSNLLVCAIDTKLLEALYWKGIPVYDMGSHEHCRCWMGLTNISQNGKRKGYTYRCYPPVWLRAFNLRHRHGVAEVGAAYNIGIFHWRPTEPSVKLLKEWNELFLSDDKIWDQNGFNGIVHKQLGPSLPGNSGLVYAFDGNLKLGLLPASIFCSGHTYFVQAMPKQFRLHPYVVHTTFQYAGTEGKCHRLSEGMLFYDPPEYYDVPDKANTHSTGSCVLVEPYAGSAGMKWASYIAVDQARHLLQI